MQPLIQRESAMTLTIDIEPPPIALDGNDVARIGGTRVTLDTVVGAFERGATAEEIVQSYPTLTLADVYAVIGYFLRHREQVEAYFVARQAQADAMRQEIDRRSDPQGLLARLRARRAAEG